MKVETEINENTEDVYAMALKFLTAFGPKKQIFKFFEEVKELEAILWKCFNTGFEEEIIKRLAEELVDVYFMVTQFSIIAGEKNMAEMIIKKMAQWDERLIKEQINANK